MPGALYEQLMEAQATEVESLQKLEEANIDLATSQLRKRNLHDYVEKQEQYEYANNGKHNL